VNPVFRPVRELSEAIRTRELSPVALAETFLERLERLGPRYNAVVTVMRERGLAEARRAEAEVAAGRWRGPLHGIPYGAKDLVAAVGAPTTWGAAPLRRQTFDFDATVIQRLAAAGAVLVAKLAMVELAGGMGYRQPNASFTGPGKSPWGDDAWSGGSSSGSGSAVASGLVPFAIGSETWGSILSPAAYCGVTGLRPTYGRVSRHGAMALCWTLDKLGPLALTADDCGLVLEAIAGSDPHDPTAADRTFDTLAEIGTVEEVTLPELPYDAIARTILFAEAASAFEDMIERGEIAELTAPEDHYTAYARDAVLAKDYIKALRLRGVVMREADRVLARVDALVAPGRPATAPPLEGEFRSLHRPALDPMGAIGNTAGLPAVAVPNGFSDGGLPTSLQFMGRAWADDTVLAAARAWQAVTDWHLRHPSID
jgi:aspartyl-tRNA(Asn)/glutamyl-tRNA(Gln) amidotransferase subunit A